jgi:hypothetical protein
MNKELVYLRLLKPWKIYRSGDVVSVPAGIMPERMIRNGVAERYVKDNGNHTENSSSKGTDYNGSGEAASGD